MSSASFRESAVEWIGWSHLLQPPVTAWLATRVLHLREAFDSLAVLPRRVVQIMGLTAVFLPTALGVVMACNARAALTSGPLHAVALLVAACLWTPRLIAQVLYVGPAFPSSERGWHWALVVIFVAQGPALAGLLVP
jgi:hypothetical protein